MMKVSLLAILAVLLLAVSPALAADKTWMGVCTSSATSLDDSDVDDAALWDGGLPGVGDTAMWDLNAQQNDPAHIIEEITIGASAAYAPDSHYQLADSWQDPNKTPIYLMKDLDLGWVKFVYGYTSGGQGDRVLRVGASGDYARAWLECTWGNLANVDGPTKITGSKGSAIIDFSGLAYTSMDDAIRAETENTGVTASTAYHILYIRSEDPGATEFVKVEPEPGSTFVTSRWNYAVNEAYGRAEGSATLNLTGGSVNLDLSEGRGTDPACVWLAGGSALQFSNAAVTLAQMNQSPDSNSGKGGGIAGSGGSVEFTAEAGTVTLDDPGNRQYGNLDVGSHALKMRSDQTWTDSSGFGFLRRSHTSGINMLDSIDGAALNNLGEVAFYVNYVGASQTMNLPECTVQGIITWGSITSGRDNDWNLTGDVTLAGAAVHPGSCYTPAAPELDEDFSLIFGGHRRARVQVNCLGHTLTTAMGIYVKCDTSTSGSYHNETSYGRGGQRLHCEGSTVDCGGDLLVYDLQQYAGNLHDNGTEFAENRNMGVVGDATTVINLSGNYRTHNRSRSGGGLEDSTLNMLGDGKTVEVTADPAGDGDPLTDDFASGSGAIGLLNVGAPATTANVSLINENLNDNDPANLAKTKDGEVMLAKMVSVTNGKLDCAGLGAKVGTGVSVASGATLDLNTGQVLNAGDNYTKFFGVGDQAAAWNAAKLGAVVDSDNPTVGFTAVYVAGDEKTYWQATGAGELTISAAFAAGEEWVYQNTETTTADRHESTLTITIDTDTYGNASYTATVAEQAPNSHFTINATGDPLVWDCVGGRRGTAAAGTYTIEVHVEGNVAGDADTTASLELRSLGDCDGSGGDPSIADKVQMNRKLNGQATPGLEDRNFDLDGSAGDPSIADKVLLNRILNGQPIP